MTFLHAILLGIIQGITEFLPISSDGHLVIMESLLKLNVEELKAFDVVLHLGTWIAMVAYFRKDLWALLTRPRHIGYIVLASIPAALVGITLEDQIDGMFRDSRMVYGMLIIMGIFYLIAERFPVKKDRWRLTLVSTFVMGIAQAFALIQGISRSGSVMGTGLLFGLKREEAARFSFILGTPIIAGAIGLTGLHIYQGEMTLPATDVVVAGFLASLIAGYLSVAFLMKFLKTHSLKVFSIYLFVLAGAGLLLETVQ